MDSLLLMESAKDILLCVYFTFSTVFGWGLFINGCSHYVTRDDLKCLMTKVPLFFLFSLIMMERALGWDQEAWVPSQMIAN